MQEIVSTPLTPRGDTVKRLSGDFEGLCGSSRGLPLDLPSGTSGKTNCVCDLRTSFIRLQPVSLLGLNLWRQMARPSKPKPNRWS